MPKTTSRGKPKPGSDFEKIVANIHRQFADGATVEENVMLPGKLSGKPRQIDVAVTTTVAGHAVLMIIECKDYKRKVGIGEVDELIGKLEDVGAATAVLVSNSGFTSDAIDRAQRTGRVHLTTVIDAQNPKVRTYLTVPFVYMYLHVEDRVGIRPIFPDGRPYPASMYERQKFMNAYVDEWNAGRAPRQPGPNVHRIVMNNAITGQVIGIEFTYDVTQELFSKRLDMTSGRGIYNVQSKQFRTNGYSLERCPALPDEIRREWPPIAPDDIADHNIRETTFFFQAIRSLKHVATDGNRTPVIVVGQ